MSTLLQRFEEKYAPCPVTGCFLWTASIDDKGYGRLFVGYNDNGHPKGEQAHRVAYRLFVGPIPADKEVCHFCDVPSCVNPRHLFLGTHKDNMDDRDRKGRTIAGQSNKTHCPRGHEYSEDNTYVYKGSRKCRICRAAATAKYRGIEAKEYEPRIYRRSGTHCKRGHPLTGDNVAMSGSNKRCRICTAERDRKYRQQKKTRISEAA